MQTVGGGFGARPAMLHAIERIRAARAAHGRAHEQLGSRPTAGAASNGFGELAFDVVVESAVEGLRKPDPRIYELVLRTARRRAAGERLPRRSRHQPQAGTRARDDDDQGDRPRPRAGRARADARLRISRRADQRSRAARADHLGQARGARAGRERHRRAREPAAHRARARAGQSAGRVARARARRRDRVEPATARAGDRGADRDRARPRGSRSSTGSSSTTCRPTTTSRWRSCARRRTSAGWRWSKGAGASSAARNPTRSRPGSTQTVDALVDAHPGTRSSRSATAASSTSRWRPCSGSRNPCGSTRGTRRCRGCWRPAPGVRSVQSLNETAHLYATREDA